MDEGHLLYRAYIIGAALGVPFLAGGVILTALQPNDGPAIGLLMFAPLVLSAVAALGSLAGIRLRNRFRAAGAAGRHAATR